MTTPPTGPAATVAPALTRLTRMEFLAPLGVLGACILVGIVLPVRPEVAILVTAVAVAPIAAVAMGSFLPLMAVPGVALSWRLGGGDASSISLADVTLVVGALAAIPLVDWERAPLLRRFLGLIVIYQGLLLVVVAGHPTPPAVFEWGHRLALMAGSLFVGAALAGQKRVATALRLYLLTAALLAVAAILETVRLDFAPPYPLGLNKNFLGNLLMMAILLAYVVPAFTGIRKGLLAGLRVLLLAGLMATQSRGAMVALFIGLLVWLWRDHRLSWRTPLPWIVGLLMVVFTVVTLRSAPNADTQFGAVNTRLNFQREALKAFGEEPVLGKGVRFYQGAREGLLSNPHNVVQETLAESGVVGSLGLIILMVGALAWLRKLDHPLAMAALVLMAAKAGHGLFDIYWLAGSLSLPWIVVGMALATSPEDPPPPPAERARHASAPPVAVAVLPPAERWSQ